MVSAAGTQHYLYVVPDGGLYIYDMDNGFTQLKYVSLPTITDARGVAVDPATASLFIPYYDKSGGASSPGWLMKYNLNTNTVVWDKRLSFSVDSPALSPDGKKLYLPESQASYSGIWHIVNTSDGSSAGTISTTPGYASHNTIVSLDGSHVYLGALNHNYLMQASTSTNQVTKQIGPLQAGVRPFTINEKETLAFTTASGYLGFEVSDITTGKLLFSVSIKGYTSSAAVPSHGISLSPDEKEVYVIDSGNSYVHVFDVSGLPTTAPKQVADIQLRSMAGNEANCSFDCQKEGWILHSLDGHYVFVGDSGDVIDTSTHKSVINLPALFDSRKFLEVDFSNGVPVATSTRHGLGHASTSGSTTPTATVPTTPGGTMLGEDTFQRTNQTGWGSASDGQKWGGDATNTSVFSITGNTGQIANGSTAYNAVLGASAGDSEVVLSGSISSFSNANLGAVLRWKDTNNWYKAYINGTNLVLQSKVNGTTTTLKSVAFTASTSTSYTIHFRAVGTTLSANVWKTGTTEPSGWQATATDTALAAGQAGLRVQVASGVTAKISAFKADVPGSSGGTTPTVTPTITPTGTVTATPTTPPASGGVLGQDTFQRSNQSLWGTASDGQKWGGDANTASVFSINGNAGQVASGNTSYNAVLGTSTTDAEVVFSSTINSFSNANIGAVVRWKDTNNWYKAYIDGSNLVLQKKVSGTTTTLKSVTFAATTSTAYSIHFQVVGNNLSARAWKAGTTEPTSWQVTASDTSLTSGQTGLRMQVSSGTTLKITSFKASASGSATATPTPAVTPTTAVTPTATAGTTPTPTPGTTPTVTVTPTTTPTTTPTPTPGTVVGQDNFQRSNQSLWGTASDGQSWSGDANTSNVFSISGNAGQIANGSTSYNAVLGPMAANADVVVSGSVSNFSNANLGAVLRWTDTTNWYKAYIDGKNLVIQSRINGTATTLKSVAFTATASTSYTIHFRAVGSTLTANVWKTGSSEPSGWMASATNSSLPTGQCGVRAQVSSGVTVKITSFKAQTV